MSDVNEVIAQALANGETNCPEGVNPAQWEMAKAVYFSQINQKAQASQCIQAAQATTKSTEITTLGNSPVPAAYTPQGSAFDLDTPTATGLAGVDGYLKCKHNQTIVDDVVVTNKEFVAEISMGDVVKKLSIRGGTAGNIKYASTTDGVTSNTGVSWMQAIQDIQRIQADARPYTSYDIPLVLKEDLVSVSFQNGAPVSQVITPKGTTLGHTTAITGKAGFESLINDLKRAGKVPSQETVIVKVIRQDRQKGSFSWATFDFVLLGDEEAAKYLVN